MPGRADKTDDVLSARPGSAPPAKPAAQQRRPVQQGRPAQQDHLELPNRPELDLAALTQSPSTPGQPGQELAVAPGRDVAQRDRAETHEHGRGDGADDRWHWRRKIRADPRKLVFYRCAVGFAGLLFVVLGLVTGPIPGPGGIPLVLLGLAIWSSEFEWAQRLMHWFKERLDQFRGWNRWQQTGFWIVFFACCGLFGYCSMVLFGVPGWVPGPPTDLLQQLPGI